MTAAKSVNLNVRVAPSEVADLRAAAADAGLSLSEWARLVLRHASGRYELGEQLARAKDVGLDAMAEQLDRATSKPRRTRHG